MVALARSPENRLTQSFREMRTPLHATLGLLAAVTLSASACRQPRPAHAAVENHAPAVAPVEPGTSADEDRDGLPDRAELRAYGDRENFRRWFAAVAEAQFYAVSPEWNEGQRDCAGLVRFALREALRPHDRAWFKRMGEAYEHVAPDVTAHRLGGGPVGEKLFRSAPGAFDEADLSNGALAEFADARTLREHNAAFTGRDARRAEAGDLLFFHQPWVQKYPYHVMLFLGRARVEAEGAADWLVYHTGSSPGDAGEVKKVRLSVLARHPDPRWRPVAANRNFLGFYRLNILQ